LPDKQRLPEYSTKSPAKQLAGDFSFLRNKRYYSPFYAAPFFIAMVSVNQHLKLRRNNLVTTINNFSFEKNLKEKHLYL